jgi:hypothetical protein
MDPYGEILHATKTATPALIYVAIGCAQGHNAPANQSPQEFPPQVAAWPGRKFVVLIDPALESPPVARVPADPPNTMFREVRRPFHWNDGRDITFLDGLCAQALQPGGPHVIVQDYTGADIRRELPVYKYGQPLLRKVLYDMTYADSGCFVDFTKISILRDAAGDFVQPFFQPLRTLVGIMEPAALLEEAKNRYDALVNYGHRFIRMETGREERRDWCTPDRIAAATGRLFSTYGVAPDGSVASMERLLKEALFDFCAVASHGMTLDEADATVAGDYADALKVLRVAMAAETAATR